MSTAFIIGAGCSAGTLGPDQCPVAGSFGAILENRGLGETYPQLGKVAEHLQVPLSKVGLEQIWTCIDYHVKFKGVFSINWSLENAVVELKTALLEIYGNPCNIAATGLSLTGEYTLSKIVNGIEPGDTVISFNYDTLLERLFLKRFRLRSSDTVWVHRQQESFDS